MSLEQSQAGRKQHQQAFYEILKPLRGMLAQHDFIHGGEPGYGDFPLSAPLSGRTLSAIKFIWARMTRSLAGGSA